MMYPRQPIFSVVSAVLFSVSAGEEAEEPQRNLRQNSGKAFLVLAEKTTLYCLLPEIE